MIILYLFLLTLQKIIRLSNIYIINIDMISLYALNRFNSLNTMLNF
jgi:hypothetical protein